MFHLKDYRFQGKTLNWHSSKSDLLYMMATPQGLQLIDWELVAGLWLGGVYLLLFIIRVFYIYFEI